ncbi:MAG: hypothetical protein R3254_07440 [Thiomicrorhabdus sp.]|nr:hypothetical protein [Thiomicrorhabdus sp.]
MPQIKILEILGGWIISKLLDKGYTMFTRKRNQLNNYGLGQCSDNLMDMANKICNVLDKEPNYAKKAAMFLIEIAAVETKLGKYWDKTMYAGMGITQIDKIGFKDTVKRTSAANKELVLTSFGIDLDRLEWVELRHNPFLCLLMTRLFLKLRPGLIPDKIEMRALYWKKWYNTEAGKGTPEHYIASINYVDEHIV